MVVALLKKLRHPTLRKFSPRPAASSTERNNASVAHPTDPLLGRDEAQLVINIGRSLPTCLDRKVAE